MLVLAGYKILVVEDEFTLAFELKGALEEAGATVVGPEPSVGRALERVNSERIDAAVLDINLDGELVFPVADALEAKAVPFMFATGYQDKVTQARYPNVLRCLKPIVTGELLGALGSILTGQR